MLTHWYIQVALFMLAVGALWGTGVLYERWRDGKEFSEQIASYGEKDGGRDGL